MKHTRSFCLLALACLGSLLSFAQYTSRQVAFGDGTTTLISDPSFKYYSSSPQLSLTSSYDNYISLYNMSGAGHFQFDANGNFVWWTPQNGNRKMMLTNDGQLRVGSYSFNYSTTQAPAMYSVVASGGGQFNDQLTANKAVLGSSTTFNNAYLSSSNNYTLRGATAANAYHSAQYNLFQILPTTIGQNEAITGYQSAAQCNTVELNNQNYTDQGTGQIWSVQTNYFHPLYSQVSKYINTYVRTQLGYGNTIGTYYSMFLEAPFGPGGTSQIGNYYGIYQESAEAKNYFGGKVWIGGLPAGTSSNDDAKLAVNGNVSCLKLKVTSTGWADYVFEKGYHLPTLAEVESFIKTNGHLPGVASAKQIEEEGNDVGESQKMLLQKVEELTLYLIDLKKEVDQLKQENKNLKKEQSQNP